MHDSAANTDEQGSSYQSQERHHLDPAPRRRRVWPWVLAIILGLIVLIPIGLILLLELGFSRMVRQAMYEFAHEHELVLEGDTEVSASLLRSSLSVRDTSLRHAADANAEPFLRLQQLAMSTNFWAVLRGDDLVVDLFELQAPKIDLRRREDGSIPGIPGEIHKHLQEHESQPALFLVAGAIEMGRQLLKDSPDQHSDDIALRLRRMTISEGSIHFPDILAPVQFQDEEMCAFFLSDISVTAENLSTHPRSGDRAEIAASLRTAGAGQGHCTVQQHTGHGGSMSLSWTDAPLHYLALPTISGDVLQGYQPQGSANLRWQLQWDANGDLNGSLVVTIYDLRISPVDDSDRSLQQLAAIMDNDESLFTWEVPFSGTISEPQAPDLTWDGLLQRLREHYLEGPDDTL